MALKERTALRLGRKLLALARDQHSAIEIGARSQFELLSERREAVTAALLQLSRAGLSDPERAVMADLQRQLAEVDARMQAAVRERMAGLQTARKQMLRFRRAVSPYLTAAPRVPSYVDKLR